MSIPTNQKQAKFVPSKDTDIRWSTFNGGLNTLFKPTELKPNELSQADNIMYVGFGTPTGRWGSNLYNQAGEAGRIRLLDAYYNSTTSTNSLVALTDSGYFTKKSGASYSIVTGASFPSGFNLQSVELANNIYIAAASQNFVRFNGTNLIPYISLGNPTNVSAAQLSAASGFTTYSWLITAQSPTGETTGSVAKTLASLPLDLTKTSVKVSWDTLAPGAAATLSGYNIYRGLPGKETLLATLSPSTVQYYDVGLTPASTIFPPLSDRSAGIKAKYVMKFGERLILAGIAGDPSVIYVSGRYPDHDSFTAINGGGYTYVSPNDGDDITGLGIAGNQAIGSPLPPSAILVFKNNSAHRVQLSIDTLGSFNILDFQVQELTRSSGASSGDAVLQVENDVYYFGRKGLYSIGLEAQFLNQIRSNELSFRVRDYVRGLAVADYQDATAIYIDNKYLISFPARGEVLLYDHERQCFALWKTPYGITKFLRYFDATGMETWLAGTSGVNTGTGLATAVPTIQQLSPAYISDNGTTVSKTLRTRKEDMGNWSIFKTLKLFYVLFRNIRGNVNINLRLEDKTGNTIQAKSFSVAGQLGNGGWGNDQWGDQQWGETNATIVLTGDEIARYSNIFKNCRVAQVEVTSTDANANFEFLQVRLTSQPLGDQSLPTTMKV